MSELEKAKQNGKGDISQDVINDLDNEGERDLPPIRPGIADRVRKVLNTLQQGGPTTKQELAKDRTRSLALLIGGTVGAVLLFIGVFSTPTPPPTQSTSGRAVPNLGAAPTSPSAPRSSVTPLLSADVVTSDGNSDQVSAGDIQATARRVSSDDINRPAEATGGVRTPRASSPPAKHAANTDSFPNAGPDPLPYRLNSSSGTPTYSYGTALAAGSEPSRTYAYGGAAPISAETRPRALCLPIESILFLRSP